MGSNETSNVTDISNGSDNTLNFTQIWIPQYDLDNVTVAIVLADINSTFPSIIEKTENFFTEFFGVNGFVTLNITVTPVMPILNMTENGPIPLGLTDIVKYIITHVETKVKVICPQCNFSFPIPTYN